MWRRELPLLAVAMLLPLAGCWDWSRPGSLVLPDGNNDAGVDSPLQPSDTGRDSVGDMAADSRQDLSPRDLADGASDGASDAPEDVLPTDVLPADVLPTDVLPADVLPADVLPADVLPADVLPADVLPADVLPADVLPADVLPADTTPPCLWTVRRKLTFDNAAQASALDGFPVLVVLTPARLDYQKTFALGKDLRFTDADGVTPLPYEIERWVNNGTSLIWVRVPRIDAASKTDHIWLYHNAAGTTDKQQPSAVWSQSYRAVWHLTSTTTDSVGTNNGVASGSNPVAGQIAGARRFDGVNDYIQVTQNTPIDNIFAGGGTISAWIYATGWSESGFGRIVDKSSNTSAANGYGLQLDSNPRVVLFDVGFTTRGLWESSNNSIKLNSWHHVVVTYDSGSPSNDPTIYIDGKKEAVTQLYAGPAGSSPDDSTRPLRIGNFSAATTRTFDGTIDEVRFAKTQRTADWVAAQYLSQTDSLITYGPEEPTSPGACPPTN
jgi:hypothetical protein